MPEPFYGEIQAFAFGVQPTGWLPCDGRSLPVAQNPILYSLIGNRYGGDTTNFNIPDLRGRTPVGVGESPSSGISYELADTGGVESVKLLPNEIPSHLHAFNATPNPAKSVGATGGLYAETADTPNYPAPPLYATPSTPLVEIDPASVQASGGGQAHNNMQPFCTLNYMIANTGIYPDRS